MRHRASESYAAGEAGDVSYENAFDCIAADVRYRPRRRTPRPVIHGVHTAVVVGPAGEEIFVDRYGRVKVQFHWDREGRRDENSSCWLRVATAWAGNNWGIVFTPRVGQEVVVSFLGGDPDQPLVTGSVYNADHMPPYTLPDHKTQSGIKTRSTPGGSPANFNEIRFEDKKGRRGALRTPSATSASSSGEQVQAWAAARSITIGSRSHRDRRSTTRTITVANDRAETVAGNETLTVAKNRARTVLENEFVFVALTRTEVVGINEAIIVGAAREVTVGGLQTVTVGGHADGHGRRRSRRGRRGPSSQSCKTYSLDAADEVRITTGAASLTMKKDGTIELKGKTIKLEATQKIEAKAPEIAHDAASKHNISGAMVTSEASAINTVRGAQVKINT